VNRIKHERTVVGTVGTTGGETHEGGEQEQKFADLAQETDHDKMEKLAQDMEKKFKEINSVIEEVGRLTHVCDGEHFLNKKLTVESR